MSRCSDSIVEFMVCKKEKSCAVKYPDMLEVERGLNFDLFDDREMSYSKEDDEEKRREGDTTGVFDDYMRFSVPTPVEQRSKHPETASFCSREV